VARGTDVGAPRSAAPGYAAPAPRSSSVTGPGASRLYLPGPHSFLPPPINWRRVGDETEFACSQDVTVERLLHKSLASVHQNILCLIRGSLKREKHLARIPLVSSALHHFYGILFFIALVPG
jgi:hypothetical protein